MRKDPRQKGARSPFYVMKPSSWALSAIVTSPIVAELRRLKDGRSAAGRGTLRT
jgi:hypothetical protein